MQVFRWLQLFLSGRFSTAQVNEISLTLILVNQIASFDQDVLIFPLNCMLITNILFWM